MNRSKYIKLIAAAAILCLLSGGAAALQLLNNGTVLYPEPSDSYEVSFQTEVGTHLNAVFGEENSKSKIHASASDAGTAEYTVNINTATAAELEALLPGIGKKKAAAIVEHRTNTGGFRSVEELIEVEGIGPGLLEKIRPYCVIAD